MILRDVISDNYIQRPKGREKQVGKESVSTPKSYCPLGCLTLGTDQIWNPRIVR